MTTMDESNLHLDQREKERRERALLEREQRETHFRDMLKGKLRFEGLPAERDQQDSFRGFYEVLNMALDHRWNAVGIGSRHDKAVGKACQPFTKAFEAIRAKLGTGFIYLLAGPRGTGKTQLATDLCRVAVEKSLVRNTGGLTRYTTALNLFLAIRATFKPDCDETEESVLASFIKPDLVVLDEVQERSGTDFESRVITQLIDARYSAQKDTVLIGNLKAEEAGAVLGPSVVSRLNECGGIIETTWPSFREQCHG